MSLFCFFFFIVLPLDHLRVHAGGQHVEGIFTLFIFLAASVHSKATVSFLHRKMTLSKSFFRLIDLQGGRWATTQRPPLTWYRTFQPAVPCGSVSSLSTGGRRAAKQSYMVPYQASRGRCVKAKPLLLHGNKSMSRENDFEATQLLFSTQQQHRNLT